MYDLEEMATWTPDEVLAKIRDQLPKGWELECGVGEDNWVFAALKDGEGDEQWSETNVDAKLLFLDLLGWLMLRGEKVVHPVWQRTGEVDPNKQFRGKRQSRVDPDPDPEDLDPAAVAAFHRQHKDEQ